MIRRSRIYILLAPLVFVLGWLFSPARLLPRRCRPRRCPAGSYDESLVRIQHRIGTDSRQARPDRSTLFLSHDGPTELAVVLFHGYTNCPRQFLLLGEELHALGHTVLIPRMPHHGIENRLTQAHRRLTSRSLIQFCGEVIDEAVPLGRRICVAGISAGGLVAAWAAIHRPEVARALLISPAFGFAAYPLFMHRPLMHFLLTVPNFFHWWDGRLKAAAPTPPHSYPRYSSRALGNLLRLSFSLRSCLVSHPVEPTPVTFLVNEGDRAVNAAAIRRVVRLWQARAAAAVKVETISATDHLAHDFVDPSHSDLDVSRVYPLLKELIIGIE